MTAPYRCPTPCDEDCELNGWGCHEAHEEAKRQGHAPAGCETRTLVAALRWLLKCGWVVQQGLHPEPAAIEPSWVQLGDAFGVTRCRHDGGGPGEALARAVDWSIREGIAP